MRTILLAVVSMIAALLQIAGVEITIAEREGLVNNLVIVVAALGAIYTRYDATRNLKTGGLLKPVAPPIDEDGFIDSAKPGDWRD